MNLFDIVLALPAIVFFLILALPRTSTDLIRKFALFASLAIFLVSLGLIPGVLSAPAQMTLRD